MARKPKLIEPINNATMRDVAAAILKIKKGCGSEKPSTAPKEKSPAPKK